MNATLLRHGCLSPSPTEVSIAFSLRSLELYRRLRLQQPCLSIQAWLKAICDTHNVCPLARLLSWLTLASGHI